jgi:polyisoprenoid-binding protein YceI
LTRGTRTFGSAAILAAGLLAGGARAETFAIQAGEPNVVHFESKAQLESFGGKTHQVQGYVTLDPAHLADSIDVYVEVDLASLDTGISIRNQHMRDNHLETAKYPKAVFRGGKVLVPSAAALAPGDKVSFDLDGTLDLHGVQRPQRAAVEITASAPGADRALHVTSRFAVKLSDHKISRPKFLILKLDEVQHVTLEVIARPKAAQSP